MQNEIVDSASTESGVGAKTTDGGTQALVERLRAALALAAEDEAGLNELLRNAKAKLKTAKRMLLEPSDEAIVNGMEASVLGRASVDDDTYVLSIYRAMTREAIEAIDTAMLETGTAAKASWS